MSSTIAPRFAASSVKGITPSRCSVVPRVRGGRTASRAFLAVKATAEAQTVAAASQNGASPSQMARKDDVEGPMLTPSPVNTSLVRSLTMFAAVAAAASGTSAVLPTHVTAFAHILSYGLWLGSNIWNTFFVGLTMFKTMPRQTFGRTQAALFPKYFTLTTGANIVLLTTLLLATASPVSAATLGAAALKPPAVSLIIGLLSSVINAVQLEPKTTAIMFERYDLENKAEKTEEDKAQIMRLQKQFGKMHGISSLLNLINTCAALAYGWFLAGALTIGAAFAL